MTTEPTMTMNVSVSQMKKARRQLGTPAALNEAIVATGIDALFVLLDGGTVKFGGVGICELGSPDCLDTLQQIADAWAKQDVTRDEVIDWFKLPLIRQTQVVERMAHTILKLDALGKDTR